MAKSSDNLKPLSPQRLYSISSILRKSWPIWTFILTLLLGLGIVQVQAVKLVVPAVYLGYILLGMVLLYSLGSLVFLSVRNSRLVTELAQAQQEIDRLEKRSSPVFLLEDMGLTAMMVHYESRKEIHRINPIKLDLLQLLIRVVGSDTWKDAETTYYLKGTNISDHTLTGLYLSIAGDNLVPLSHLGAKLYNVHADPAKEHSLKPILQGPDSISKNLFLPFFNPGVEPFASFNLELSFRWPKSVHRSKDYWFLDNIDYEGATKQLTMVMEFVDLTVESVRVYTINPSSRVPQSLGAITPESTNPSRFVFSKISPERDTYYIFVFEDA